MALLPITSHITHLGQEAEGCQVSLSTHLSQTGATAPAWNFKSAGARPFWEKEEAPPIHKPPPRSLLATLETSVEDSQPLILQVERLRHRGDGADVGARSQVGLGSEPKLSTSPLRGEAL